MPLEVTDGTFYMVRLPTSETIHQDEDTAIDFLNQHAEDADPESDAVSVVKVSVEGEDWTIAEMSWQSIALQLMGGN